MPILRHTLLFLLVLFACQPSIVAAQSDPRAMAAMAQMRFNVQSGDISEVVIRHIGKSDLEDYKVHLRFKFIKADQSVADLNLEAYRLRVVVKSFELGSARNIPDVDRAVKAIFPPFVIQLNPNFETLSILNWDKIVAFRRKSADAMKAKYPRAAVAVKLFTKLFASEGFARDFFTPIAEMQPRVWRRHGNVFILDISRHMPANIILARPFTLYGTRTVAPIALSEGKVFADTRSRYDTSSLVEALMKSPVGSLAKSLKRDERAALRSFRLTMQSNGRAQYDVKTGWLERMVMTLTTNALVKGQLQRSNTITLAYDQKRLK